MVLVALSCGDTQNGFKLHGGVALSLVVADDDDDECNSLPTSESLIKSGRGEVGSGKICCCSSSGCGDRNGFVLSRVSFACTCTGRSLIGETSASVPVVENCSFDMGRGIADVLVLTMVGDGLALRPAQLAGTSGGRRREILIIITVFLYTCTTNPYRYTGLD